MSRRALILILFLGLAATLLLMPGGDIREVAGLPNFTIPTRTPVPPPTTKPPTAVPPPPGGDNPPPATATNVPPPTASATNTPIPVTLAATPAGGFLPTAVACGAPPTIQTKNTTLVRSGPGTDYPTVSQLVYLEVRPIVGRAGDTPWWLIELPDDQTGWVANNVVTVQGYIGDVPIVGAPANSDDQTPTPGALWQPTAVPDCPTSTATAAATATRAPTTTATPLPPTATATETAVPQPTTATRSTEPTLTATSVVPAGAATVEAVAVSAPDEQPEATAVPLDESAANSAAALPCASAALGIAVAGFFISRRFW